MKTIRKTILILAGIVSLVFISSCTPYEYDIFATITGKVLDEENQPIEGAYVYLTPSGNDYVTLADGSFEFKDLDATQYTITVQKSGYSTNRKSVNAIAGETTDATIKIERQQ